MKKTLFLLLSILTCGVISAQDLVITEISYNPAESGTDSTEYIEIYNNGAVAVDMEGYTMGGVTYTFPAVTIASAEYLVITVDSLAMINTYGYEGAYEWSGGGLSNGGETITLFDADAAVVDVVDYDDGGVWPGEADQGGYSLVLCDVTADNNDGANWEISATDAGIVVNALAVFGSPGMDDEACVPACVPTESEIAVEICESYTVPSGEATYTESGVYTDVIENEAGCDSTITIDLTILAPTESEIAVEICESYTVPSGDATYTESGVYTDVIENEAGCDSTITIDLTILEPTESEIAVEICESYTVPSGEATYTESGVYTDVIENEAGCDSTITIDLTILEPTESEIAVEICESYTVPSGEATYTESGVYTDVIENEAGCDSTITIDLTILAPTESEIAVEICESYTVPSGEATYTESGVYIDVIENEAGCDSTITIDLTILEPTESEIAVEICESYTVPSGEATYTESGVYTDVIENEAGCDSTITIDLTILAPTESEIAVEICESYTVPSGEATYTESGVYTDVIENEAGCDSTITIDLTILAPTESEIIIEACESYTVPSGEATYTESGVYTDVIENEAGCDSTITIDLTILEVDASFSVDGVTLTANEGEGTYQWVRCDEDFEAIDGATDQSFTPTENGEYAVIVTVGECSDTSSCIEISFGGGPAFSKEEISIYPNPTQGMVNISFGELTNVDVRIFSISGAVVYSSNSLTNSVLAVELETAPGLYVVEVSSEGHTEQFKLVVD